jgi:peptidoglycan/xylan/chitin deacetylase (PgdA/CDA1 family)
MFINEISKVLKYIFPKLIWKMNKLEIEKTIYLTFDDGPTPEITNYVLDLLTKYNAKATFFCIGNNLKSNRELAQQILNNGHKIGNHTMNHVNSWHVNANDYFNDYLLCENEINNLGTNSVGFRPPYGRINRFIYKKLINYTPIYMWSFISGDYNRNNNPHSILKSAKKNINHGSILIFHDSKKAFPILSIILEPILEYCSQNNFECKTL